MVRMKILKTSRINNYNRNTLIKYDMNNNPKISIIVPVYNVEQYLPRCIDSILNQSFADFELLLIDDGSKDKSGAICDEYAAQDSRIRVFRKENGGVSSARNLGLDNACGEWIAFVDADDSLKERFLNDLFVNTDVDIDLVIGGYQEFGDYHNVNKIENKQIFDFSDSAIFLDIDPKRSKGLSIFYYPWGKLYRSSVLAFQKLRFSTKMKLAEDSTFLIAFASQAKKGALVPFADYEYRRLSGAAGKYSMNYEAFCLHVDEFDMAVCEFSKTRGFKLDITQRTIHKSFFFNFFRWLKLQDRNIFVRCCDLYLKRYGYKGLVEISSDRSFAFKCYMLILFYFPYIGFYIKNR